MSDNITYALRAATQDDWPFIEAVHRLPHVTPWTLIPSRASFSARLDDSGSISQIIEREGRPFGYMLMRYTEWLLELGQLVVAEPRKGAGRFALQRAIDQGFNDLKLHRIYLEIVESNEASRRLCESVGFRAEGVFRDGYHSAVSGYQNLVPYGLLASDLESNV